MVEVNTSSVKQLIVNLAQKDIDIQAVWLYGSRARGDEHKASDYDFAVLYKTYIEDPLDRRLRPEMQALEWKKQLDLDLSLLDIQLASLPLAYSVVKDNCLLFCRDDLAVAIIEQKIMSKWEIDFLYHQKHFTNGVAANA